MEGEGLAVLEEALLQEKSIFQAPSEDLQHRDVLNWLNRPLCEHDSDVGGWKAAIFMLGLHSFQSLAASGCTINLVLFLVQVLKQDNASASNIVTTWIGTTCISSLIGGALGDTYLGRLWTTILYQILFITGSILLTVSSISLLNQGAQTCPNVHGCSLSPTQVNLFYASLYVMGVGSASTMPNLISLGADQFDSQQNKSKFISMFIASSNVGMMLSTSVISYLENEAQWTVGLWLSAGSGIAGFFIFLIGIPRTRQFRPGRNPLVTITHVLITTVRNVKLKSVNKSHSIDDDVPVTVNNLRESNKKMKRWSKNLCTSEQVQEVKSLCNLVPFWLCGICVSAVTAQKGTFFLLQGATMENQVFGGFRFPPASMGMFSLATVVLGAPLYSWFIAPLIKSYRKQRQDVSSVERMGLGLLVATLAFLVAAIVESLRLRIAHRSSIVNEQVPMSIFWLIPQYVLEGWTVVFFVCGHLDYNYTFSPQGMQSLGTAISLSGFALGNYLSSFIVKIITSCTSWIPRNLNEGHLDCFYYLLDAVLLCTLVLFVLFVTSSKWVSKDTNADTDTEPVIIQ